MGADGAEEAHQQSGGDRQEMRQRSGQTGQQQSAPRQDRFPSQTDHPAMPSAMTGSIGQLPGQMATTTRASRTPAAWAAHIRFWVPSPAVAPEPSRAPRRRLARPSTGMITRLDAVRAMPSGVALAG